MSETGVISLRIQRPEQLFQTLDPYPFSERDLSPEAENYIVDFAREMAPSRPLQITVHLAEGMADSEGAPQIGVAIRNYFAGRAGALGSELRELFRIGWRAAGVGVVVLAACVGLGQVVLPSLGWDNRFLSESFVILGWVANWKPLEIFLYDWWPIVRRRRLYRRLALAEVSVEGRALRAGLDSSPP